MNESALKERLHAIAKEKGITFNECWKQLLLERFLSRIAKSKQSEKLIFKGGFLLSYSLQIGRETMDLDFLLSKLKSEELEVKNLVEEIAAINLNDGFIFSWGGIEKLLQPHMNYPGFRLILDVKLGNMKDKIQIDLGVGDVVTPEKKQLSLFKYKGKPIFEGEITLLVYPLETIFAEKLETVISRGTVNSRMKDYHDLVLLSRSGELDSGRLMADIKATFETRGTTFNLPIHLDTSGMVGLQKLWEAHIRGLGEVAVELKISYAIKELIDELNTFLKYRISDKGAR